MEALVTVIFGCLFALVIVGAIVALVIHCIDVTSRLDDLQHTLDNKKTE